MRTREGQIEALVDTFTSNECRRDVAQDILSEAILEAEHRAEQRVRAEIARDSERLDGCMYCDQTEFGGDCMHENPCPAWEEFKKEEKVIDAAREKNND